MPDGGGDTLAGGLGSDIYVTDGGDILKEGADAGIDTVRSSKSHGLGDNVETMTRPARRQPSPCAAGPFAMTGPDAASRDDVRRPVARSAARP